jgi:GntR family transcriptional regulator
VATITSIDLWVKMVAYIWWPQQPDRSEAHTVVALSLYQRIAAQLRAQITSGQLTPGDKLPSETKLIEQFGCSRDTIKDATALLVNEGLIERVAGRHGGMVVRDQVRLTFHGSFAEPFGATATLYGESDAWHADVRAQGLQPSQDFECRIVMLTEDQAALLRLDGPEPAVDRICIRYVNDRTSSIQHSYYPQWLVDEVPELRSPEDVPGGTIRLIADRGHVQTGYMDRVVARMATPEEAAILRIGAGTPVLIKTRVACTAERVTRLTVEVMAGDRNAVEYEIGEIGAIRGPEDES